MREAGVTGQDRDELIKVLNGQLNNKFLSQKINNDPTYYEHEKEKLSNLLKIIASNFPNVDIIKFWQKSVNGDSHEGYCVVNKNFTGSLLNALKTSTTKGFSKQYHRQMGEIYGFKPEEIEEFVSKEPEVELPEKTVDPSLIIQDVRTNQSQKIV